MRSSKVETADINNLFALPSSSDKYELNTLRKHFTDVVCQDVTDHQLIDRARFPDCRTKPASSFPGCIFAGTNKAGRPKEIYVKHYAKKDIVGIEINAKFDCLMDYAAFNILKCGRARAPKVRICASKQDTGKYNFYIFSTDIAHARSNHQDKTYFFSDLGEESKLKYLPQKGILSSRVDIFPNPQASEDFKPIAYTYKIDYPSTARLLVLGLILQLSDLHEGNVGFVLSRKGNDVKGKLTFIDFFTQESEIIIDEHTFSLKSLLYTHYNVNSAAQILSALVERISEEEFVAAFREIAESGIADQCDALKRDIKKMDFVSKHKKASFNERMKTIETNISKLQKFVDRTYGRSSKCVIC